MKDIFYTILVVIFFLIAYSIENNPRQYRFKTSNSGVIVDKSDDFIQGPTFIIKDSLGEVSYVRCYSILFDKYKVGDTIKVKHP